jgi:bifunctional non-homologous end joining protein LigD
MPDELWFPEVGIRRSDVIYHYRRVAEVMLPHLERRPLRLERVLGQSQIQRGTPRADDAPSLHRLVSEGCVAFHGWVSRIDKADHPDRLVFDLDPGDPDFARVARAALALRDLLEELHLSPWVMTTGSRGLHVVVPLDGKAPVAAAQAFARAVVGVLADRAPDLVGRDASLTRADQVSISTARNGSGRTCILPYSLRLRPGAPVATPLSWSEVGKRGLHAQRFTLLSILDRLESIGDPWAGMARHARSLREPARRLMARRQFPSGESEIQSG